MKTKFLAATALCALSGTLLFAADAKQKELLRKFDDKGQMIDTFNARKSGAWNSDIWGVTNPLNDKNTLSIQKGKRPRADADCRLFADNITVTLSEPVAVNRLFVCRKSDKLVLANGADLTANHGYYGFCGAGTGGMEVREGAVFRPKMHFFIAGLTPQATGTGSFVQSGGIVNSEATIFLSGHAGVMSTSPTAVGVYTLSGGTLNIRVPGNRQGISDGTGNGKFFFGAGTLNTNRIAVNLENVNGGNFSPGGDDAVGETRLIHDDPARQAADIFGRPYDESRTYRQSSGSVWTVNIASKSAYDRCTWRTANRAGRMIFESGATIKIVPLKGYKPSAGASFDIAVADSIEIKGQLRIEGMRGFVCECPDGKTLRLRYAP